MQKVLLSLFLFLFSFILIAQNSENSLTAFNEKDNVAFQNIFFKALSQKAIFNYKKAIEYLRDCNQLYPNNESVLFELSKNNLKLARNIEALNYIELALNIAPNNIWMLEHQVSILRKMAAFKEAIKIQQKIIKIYPKKKQYLVYLHLQNSDTTTAKKVLLELKEAKLLNPMLRRILNKLNNTIKKQPKKIINADLQTLFEQDKSFSNLKPLLLELAIKKHPDLLKYSSQGVALFPAQPFVYLMSAKAFNQNKQYKKALQNLQNGIDFVIDNPQVEAKFYLEMATTYKYLKDIKKANIFKNKAVKILQ